jgi:hypothetical protein
VSGVNDINDNVHGPARARQYRAWSSRHAAPVQKQTGLCSPKRRKAMANPTDPDTDKNEMRVMWIGSAAIVLLILVAMVINMLIAHNTGAGSVETGSQSATVPPK